MKSNQKKTKKNFYQKCNSLVDCQAFFLSYEDLINIGLDESALNKLIKDDIHWKYGQTTEYLMIWKKIEAKSNEKM